MNSKFFSFLLVVFCLIGFASAWDICIDTQAPEAPEGLIVSGNVILGWNDAFDEPDCSSVEYYNIYLDGVLIGSSTSLSYSGGALADGNYIFGVSAVDEGENEGSRAVKEVVFPLGSGDGDGGSSGGGSSGGGGSSSSSPSSSGDGGGSSSDSSSSNSSESSDDYGMTLINGDVENDEGGSNGFFSTITGAVAGAVGTVGGVAVGVFILLALGGFVIILVRKKKKKD